MKKAIAAVPIALIAVAAFAGCSTGSNPSGSDGLDSERKVQANIENEYSKAQPVPALTNSQVRQNLIEIQEAVAEGVDTTSFFFNLGAVDPVKTCPSIGVPIPSTAQLTNPEQVIEKGQHDDGSVTIPQMDPTGIYSGDSEGTYVLCIDARGNPYVSYFEGFVMTEFAPAKWNRETHETELLGSSSWEFSKSTPPSGTTNNPER